MVKFTTSHSTHLFYQVSEAYTLQRQTFYLAQDYLDRFLLTQNNIEKGMLQLIGITCLFIASKMEVKKPKGCKSNFIQVRNPKVK